ncbi:Sulfotransferase domain [Trinorchestia longiramus]|nr:Sulfotransferase domain [Trinorchestia longiramus]
MAAISLMQMAENLNGKNLDARTINGIPFRGVWNWNGGKGSSRGARFPWCKDLKFVDPPGQVSALASFPGSGNTWLRYLLQQVTGYHTGSVYKDFALMKNGFPAESISNGSVIIVKTHEYGEQMRAPFSRAILIIRDPYQAILAEFNRQSGGHIGHAQPDKYSKDNGKYWSTFVHNKALSWTNTYLDWLQFKGPLHVLFYEDLVENLANEMNKILEFLDFHEDIPSFECMMRNKDGIYKRRKRNLSFNPYSQSMRDLIDYCKKTVDSAIKAYFSNNSDMETYVNSLNLTRLSEAALETKGKPEIKGVKLAR